MRSQVTSKIAAMQAHARRVNFADLDIVLTEYDVVQPDLLVFAI
jgi:hypothetical protein